MAFLHGIEHLNLAADMRPVNDVVTAVIGLIGTADGTADINTLYLCKNEKDDAVFGNEGTIPESLKAIRLQSSTRGSALVFVISVGTQADTITGGMIVGEVSATGERTGLKLFETARGRYGFEPMIFIAPHYSALSVVKSELQAIVAKTEAMAYIDTPDGFTFDDAMTSRGVGGEFANLDEGQKLLFPHFLVGNPDYVDGGTEPKFLTVPMSATAAGLRAKVDLELGWHQSSSNNRYYGVEGMDVDLTFSLGDPGCEANLLNSVGIVTAVNMFGNGINEWGNYSTGFPGNTALEAFECVRRTRAIMKRAIEQACVPFIDRPFIQANVDAIRSTVNVYLNGLVAGGELVAGTCLFKPENNPVAELAKGHLTFDIEFTPAVPMQELTFTYKIDLSQLSSIA